MFFFSKSYNFSYFIFTIKIDETNSNQKRFAFNACKSRPCMHDSFCESLAHARFRCHCPLGKSGIYCEKEYKSFIFPQFKNYSFLELNYPDNRLQDLTFDIEFKSTQLNGLIFFASQFSDGSGTLLSLVLRDGFLELRYNYKGLKRLNFEIFGLLKSEIFLYH